MEIAELKAALASRAEEVCRHLLPNGKAKGGEWVCGDISGVPGDSFKVKLSGDKAGVFRDFASEEGGSNLLELWIQCRGIEFQEARAEASELIGEKVTRVASHTPRRAYSKPDLKGIVHLENRAEFYLVTERKIPIEVVREFKIAMTSDGGAIVYPSLSEVDQKAQMVKYVALERDDRGKKKSWTSKNTPKVLFGKHLVRPSDRHLLIVEGENDAMSWKALGLPKVCVCSVPFGAKWEGENGKDPNDEWIQNDWDFIHRFERIYLSFDHDTPGEMAVDSIIKRIGREISFVVTLPEEGDDGNKLWQDGDHDSMRQCFAAAKTQDPATLKGVSDYREEVLNLFESEAETQGIKLPFGDRPFHLRWNELTVVTGINGSGKTQLLGYLSCHHWSLGFPTCTASMEVKSVRTLMFYATQAGGNDKPSREEAERTLDWMTGGFWLYDRVGKSDYKDIIVNFRYAYRRHGVRFFIIDSWMKLGIKSDDLDAQSEALAAINQFTDECDVHVFLVCHPRKGRNEDDSVGKMDIKGTGEITDVAHNVSVLTRNKKKEAEVEALEQNGGTEEQITDKRRARPDATLKIEKQRNGKGDEPTYELWFQKDTKQYFPHYRKSPKSFLTATEAEPDAPAAAEATEPLDVDAPF